MIWFGEVRRADGWVDDMLWDEGEIAVVEEGCDVGWTTGGDVSELFNDNDAKVEERESQFLDHLSSFTLLG